MSDGLVKLEQQSAATEQLRPAARAHAPLLNLLKKLRRATLQDRLVATSFKGPGFDQVRLVAATIVLLHHCRGVRYPDVWIDPLFEYSGGYMDFGRFAVAIFFAISGFLVTPSLMRSGNVTKYAIHRGLRIFPGLTANVVVTMLVLGPLLTTLSLQAYFADTHLLLYLKNVLTLTSRYLPGVVSAEGAPLIVNGPLWTLHYEVLCYAALALMSMLGILRLRGWFLVLWIASYAVYASIGLEPAIARLFPERIATLVSLFVYFGGGIFLYLFRERVPFCLPLALSALASALVALPCGWGPIVMPLCLSYVAVFCGLCFLPGRSLLRHDLSYGVYLIHAPVLTAFVIWFPTFKVWPIVAVIVMLVTLLLAYLSWVFVEKPALDQKRKVASWFDRRVAGLRPETSA